MKPHLPRSAIALVTVIGALVAIPAHGATVTQTNACFYNVNEEYRNQLVTLSGVGSPAGAPAGAIATLSGASLSAQLPPSLPEQGYETGIFHSGYNEVPSRVWVAISATNAIPATQYRELNTIASTTITTQGGDTGEFVSGTPIEVTIPIPDTTWTVAAAGPVTFAQAGPGTLPSLPVGNSDAMKAVKGSIVVKPKLAGLLFVMDCQPGTTSAPFTSVVPALGQPFAALDAAAPVPPVPPPPPAAKPPKPRVASKALKLLGGRVGVVVGCPAGKASCKGRLVLRSLAPVRLGARRAVLGVTARRSYTVPAGRTKTLRLALTPAARRVMRTRKRLGLRVTLQPSAGANVTRILTLTR